MATKLSKITSNFPPIGRKSTVLRYTITNTENAENPYTVLVQANKNHGICDILVESEQSAKVRMSEVLSVFQGRQFDDNEVREHLYNTLNEALNPVKE